MDPQTPAEPWDGVSHPRTRSGKRFLKDVIVTLGLAEPARVEQAHDEARNSGVTFEEALLGQGVLTQDALARAIAERHGLDHLDLAVFKVDMAAANLIKSGQAKRYEAVPVAFVGANGLLVAMADPGNVMAIDEIALVTGHDVRPAAASRAWTTSSRTPPRRRRPSPPPRSSTCARAPRTPRSSSSSTR